MAEQSIKVMPVVVDMEAVAWTAEYKFWRSIRQRRNGMRMGNLALWRHATRMLRQIVVDGEKKSSQAAGT